MSKLTKEKFECPRCSKEMEIDIWNSVNVTLDPEMKSKLLDASIFEHKCDNCANTIYMEYGLLYHDMEKKLMLFFSPNKSEENNRIDLPDDFGFGTEGYTYRIVEEINNLKETISIFDAGLDDVTIHYIKHLLRNKIIGAEYFDIKDDDTLLFDGIEDDFVLIAQFDREFEFKGWCRLPIVDKYLVSKTKIDNDLRFADSNGYRIDEDWIHSKLIEL